MENLTEWTIGRPTKKPLTLPAVKVVEPRHTPMTFILHDFMEVMLIKMKGFFEDITIFYTYILYYVVVCSVYYIKSFSKEFLLLGFYLIRHMTSVCSRNKRTKSVNVVIFT